MFYVGNATEEILTLNGPVILPVCRTTFPQWRGAKPDFNMGSKPFIDRDGRPVFAEIGTRDTLAASGEFDDAAWVSNWGGRYFIREQPQHQELAAYHQNPPAAVANKLAAIALEAETTSVFDVVAWSGGELFFFEAKRSGRDSVRQTQKRFIAAALNNGVAIQQMMLIEWSFD